LREIKGRSVGELTGWRQRMEVRRAEEYVSRYEMEMKEDQRET
jgi:hypothetical protein